MKGMEPQTPTPQALQLSSQPQKHGRSGGVGVQSLHHSLYHGRAWLQQQRYVSSFLATSQQRQWPLGTREQHGRLLKQPPILIALILPPQWQCPQTQVTQQGLPFTLATTLITTPVKTQTEAGHKDPRGTSSAWVRKSKLVLQYHLLEKKKTSNYQPLNC